MTNRFLFAWAAILLLFVNVADAGRYQRTKDRQIRVWNEHPERWDEAVWTGERDENGYATGTGVLTWYRVAKTTEIGTFIPSARGHELEVVRSFSGTMIQGRFDGWVVTSDPAGKNFHAKYADGTRSTPWTRAKAGSEAAPAPDTAKNAAVAATPKQEPQPPAESPAKVVPRSAIVEAPTQDSHTLEVFRPPTALRPTYVTATAPQSSPPAEPPRKDGTLTEFEQQTQSVFAGVGDATGNFRKIETLDSVQPLPSPISENIRSLSDRARDVRLKSADSSTLRTETETADALSVVNETTRALAAKNASGANSKVTQFLKNHPTPPTDAQKPLWHYLASTQSLCDRQQKAADAHLQRAQSLAADHPIEALEEYKEANRLFPSPNIAEMIRQLSTSSAAIDHADR